MSLRTSKFTESKSVRNRLSESLEDIDYLSEEDVSVFGEEDIILVEYEDTHKTTLKKGNKSRRKVQGHKQKNSADDLDYRDIDTDDDLKVPEAIVIDFDTPTRKLVMKSRVDLKRVNLRQQMEELTRESRRTKLKLKQKRKPAMEEEEEDVDEENDDNEVSPSLADLMAKRSNLSRRLADQRKKSHKRLRS